MSRIDTNEMHKIIVELKNNNMMSLMNFMN